MLKKLLAIMLCVLMIGVVGCSSKADQGNEKSSGGKNVELKIGKVPYSHEWIPLYIIKQVAEEQGYSVQEVEGDIGFMFLGLAQGDIDIFPDVWLPVLHKNYVDKYQDKIELAGTMYEKAAIGLAIPSYMDINSIEDLKNNGAAVDNRIVGLEPSAGMMLTAEKTIEEYGLDNIELMEGSTPAMLAEVDQAIKNKEGIVFLSWRPHTMWTKYDIKMLEDPKGVWKYDNDMVGVNPSLKEKAPDIYQFVQGLNISIKDIEDILFEMEASNKPVEELTKQWVEENREKVNAWLGKN